jgi:hypothetical protein
MKTFVVLAVSIVLVSTFFCPMAMAAPPMPNDVQMVEPDPTLPKELADFFGKWEGRDPTQELFLIIEKIDEEKASFYLWGSGTSSVPGGWRRFQARVSKENGKYKLWHRAAPQYGRVIVEYTLKGKYLDVSNPRTAGYRYTRVP